jgi:hypothetical protein
VRAAILGTIRVVSCIHRDSCRGAAREPARALRGGARRPIGRVPPTARLARPRGGPRAHPCAVLRRGRQEACGSHVSGAAPTRGRIRDDRTAQPSRALACVRGLTPFSWLLAWPPATLLVRARADSVREEDACPAFGPRFSLLLPPPPPP